jgi:hypothetical protein
MLCAFLKGLHDPLKGGLKAKRLKAQTPSIQMIDCGGEIFVQPIDLIC